MAPRVFKVNRVFRDLLDRKESKVLLDRKVKLALPVPKETRVIRATLAYRVQRAIKEIRALVAP